ncbi:MAG: HIT family protein [Eubacterium sp.]
MRDDNCIFCKIANGDIPSTTLYEDDDFRVIFDISPATYGHALILPKEHAANVFELSEGSAAKVFVLAKKIASALKELTGCDGVNILQNNGKAANQTVFHFHMHIIPRYENDTAVITWKHLEPESDRLAEMAVQIKNMVK